MAVTDNSTKTNQILIYREINILIMETEKGPESIGKNSAIGKIGFEHIKSLERQSQNSANKPLGLGFVASKMPWTCSDLSGLHTEQTHELLEKASIIHYNFFDNKKHYSYLPIGQTAIMKIESLMREVMTTFGVQELYLTPIQPVDLWQTSGRIDEFKHKMMYLKCYSRSGDNYVMSPTNEEVVTVMAKTLVKSYKQLPLIFYQFADKFRDGKGKHGIVASNVFRVLEAYSLDANEQSLETSAKLFENAFTTILKTLGVQTTLLKDEKGYLGFMSETNAGDEQIAACSCGKRYSYPEIGDTCKSCGEHFAVTKAVNIGCIMKEGVKYSEKFNARYSTEAKEWKLIHMGTYGLGVSRILHAVVDQNRDKFGIMWPECIRPVDFCVMPVDSKDAIQLNYAKELYDLIRSYGKNVILEDRDKKLGWKIRIHDLIGTHRQIIVGKQEIEKDVVSIKHREDNTHETIKISEISQYLSKA
jgi:prolyl-tRNA synthetase